MLGTLLAAGSAEFQVPSCLCAHTRVSVACATCHSGLSHLRLLAYTRACAGHMTQGL